MAGASRKTFHLWLSRIVDVKAEEVGTLLWSGLYFFFLLSGYYILKPLREEIGVQTSDSDIPYLFTVVALTMLVLNFAFSALVTRFTRRSFMLYAYRFFIFNLLLFYLLMKFYEDESESLLRVGMATGRSRSGRGARATPRPRSRERNGESGSGHCSRARR